MKYIKQSSVLEFNKTTQQINVNMYFSVKDLICHNSSCSSGSQTSVTVGSFSLGDSARRRSRRPLLCGV